MVQQAFQLFHAAVAGVGSQMALRGGNGLHPPTGTGQLHFTGAAAQLRVQGQAKLPGRGEDRQPLRVAGAVIVGIEQMVQLGHGLVELAGMSVGHRPPVADLWPHGRSLAQDQLHQTACLLQLVGCRFAGNEQRCDAIQAQIEIDKGQRLGIVGQLLEVEGAVDVPEAFTGQKVLGIELQRAAESEQRAAVPADLGITEAAEGVLEDAQPRQDADRVPDIPDRRQQETDDAELRRVDGQDAQPDGEGGTHGGGLDLGLFLDPGEREDVEEGDAEQHLDGEEPGILVWWCARVEQAEIPDEQTGRESGASQHDKAQAHCAVLDVA